MNRFLVFSFSLLVVMAACTEQSVQYNKGEAFLMSGQMDSALHCFYNVTVSNAHDTVKGKAYIYIGYIYYKNNHTQLSLENYGKAIDYLMECPNLLGIPARNMGKIYTELEDWEPAKLYTLQAIRLYKGNQYLTAKAYLGLGVIYKNSGNYKDAMSAYKKALIIEPELKPNILNNIGNLFLSQKNYDSALHYFDLALNVGFSDTHLVAFNKARLYLDMNHLDMASQYAYQSLEDNNDMLLDSYGLISKINKLSGVTDQKNTESYLDLLGEKAEKLMHYEKLADFYSIETMRLTMELNQRKEMQRWLMLLSTVLTISLLVFIAIYFKWILSVDFLKRVLHK